MISARQERQALLGAPGRQYTQILTAGSLLWCAGRPETMIEQIDRIIVTSRLPGVSIGVIPPRRPTTVFILDALARLADYDAAARATLAAVRDTYRAG